MGKAPEKISCRFSWLEMSRPASFHSVIFVGMGAFVVGCAVVALALAWILGGEDDSIACDFPPGGSSVELVYGFQAPPGSVSSAARDETVDVICRRLRGLGMTDAYVLAQEDRVRVALPAYGANAERAIEQVGSAARLYFYDWELNLLGREALIGGNPGSEPPQAAINEANEDLGCHDDIGRLLPDDPV